MLGYKNYIVTEEEKEQIIQEMLPYIKYTAYRLSWRLPPQLTVDDLISAGIIGLLDAIEKFNPSKQATLKTYAEYRIKGAMLDELRAAEWIPKHLQKKINDMKNTYSELEKRFGRPPSEEEVAEEMGVDVEEVFKILNSAHRSTTLSIEGISQKIDNKNDGDYNIYEHLEDDSSPNPLKIIEDKEKKKILADKIRTLPEREQLILSLYYWEELTFKEIGEVLGVSESRVSQLHSQALMRLKIEMEKLS
ncbi:MAG: FliA/WhiG family RNA polymerase sigma factor [Nitrospirae bacterium]|nr:MAG: FliA/WhiG family RNA polymerase sigma factor [Nitrospirota bacterium]